MGRGLGALQREVLETLDEAKATITSYHGGLSWKYGWKCNWDGDRFVWKQENVPGWVACWGHEVRLAEDVYDLRASMLYIARKRGATYCRGAYVKPSFQSSFCRAVRGLVKRGLLAPLQVVPLAEAKEEPDLGAIQQLADGLYLLAWLRQIRFVRVKR